ncbi:DUF1758 domain-containing protein [Trichonephila clavipes]|nr:DUF1758 domain-containing protein [Trichonephila clavipes]
MESSGPWQVKRAGFRASFPKTANVLKAELMNVELSVELVRDKFTKLQSVYLDIKILDENILDLLAEDRKSSECDIANEIEDREIYSDDFITLSRQDRFGKPELLVEVYVRELIKMIITNAKADNRDKLSLDRLCDKIEAHLRALKSLGLKSKENTAWLFPMVESCLKEDVLKAWQRSSLFGQLEANDRSRLTHWMKFLKAEVEGEERFKLTRGGFDSVNHKEDYHDKARGGTDSKFKFKKQASVPTATSFLVTKDHACIFCGKMHESKICYIARELSVDERISKVKEKKCRLKCLEPNHIAKFCKQYVRCFACGKAHSVILCPGMSSKMESPTGRPVKQLLPDKFVQGKWL